MGMEIFDTVRGVAQLISVSDVVDVAITSYAIYRCMKLLKDSSAMRLAKGILIILIIQQVAAACHLNTISFVLDNTFSAGVLVLAIIFQPELRRMLEQLGKGQMRKLLTGTEVDVTAIEQCITQTVAACESMSWTRTGVLMVFERQEQLSDIIKTGTRIDSEPSAELLKNIFFKVLRHTK